MTQDPVQVIYHVEKTLDTHTVLLKEFQRDIQDIKIAIAGLGNPSQAVTKPLRKEHFISSGLGGLGGFVVAVVIGVIEYFKAKT